jgi:hypothetical protein
MRMSFSGKTPAKLGAVATTLMHDVGTVHDQCLIRPEQVVGRTVLLDDHDHMLNG